MSVFVATCILYDKIEVIKGGGKEKLIWSYSFFSTLHIKKEIEIYPGEVLEYFVDSLKQVFLKYIYF